MGFLIRLVAAAVGVAAAAWLLPSIEFTGPDSGMAELNEKVLPVLGVALILTVVNAIIRPMVKIFTFPIVVLTLGVVHAGHQRLDAAARPTPIAAEFELGFTVDGFVAAAIGSLVITIVTWGVDVLLDDK